LVCRTCAPGGAGARLEVSSSRRGRWWRRRHEARALDAGRPFACVRRRPEGAESARAAGAHGEPGGLRCAATAFGLRDAIDGGGRCFQAVTNVGNRPTFGQASFAVESHILDFEQVELDDRTPLELEFLLRLRGESECPPRGPQGADLQGCGASEAVFSAGVCSPPVGCSFSLCTDDACRVYVPLDLLAGVDESTRVGLTAVAVWREQANGRGGLTASLVAGLAKG